MHVALINTNRISPPIAPVGLEYVAEACSAAGLIPKILDLCFEPDWRRAFAAFFEEQPYDLIGVTLRNTDDCAFAGRTSFVAETAQMVRAVKALSRGFVVMGGVGFSVMPEQVLEACPADAGIVGDGEESFVLLAQALRDGTPLAKIPNLVLPEGGGARFTAIQYVDASTLPRMSRRWIDNRRYERKGGQIGFETKRGCPHRCIYCADPVAKGRELRLRPPRAVAQELLALCEQGITTFHTCDCEFNLDEAHAKAVCRAIIDAGLHTAITWYAYCIPGPFSPTLATLMRQAGCAGINFGTDSGDPRMLERLARPFDQHHISQAAQYCREAGIASMFDLLIGGPGETERSVRTTIDLFQRADPDLVGVTVGLRVYPGTELFRMAQTGILDAGLSGGDSLSDPLFFLEPALTGSVHDTLRKAIGDDPRFIFFDPDQRDTNYNYNANQVLSDAIDAGYRGAYWDILRRLASEK